MAKDVKETKSKSRKKESMIEIEFLNAAVGKGGKILDEMIQGGSILEYSLHEAEMSIKLADNGIDKDGNRFDPETKYIISIKGKKDKPKVKRMANLKESKAKGEDEISH